MLVYLDDITIFLKSPKLYVERNPHVVPLLGNAGTAIKLKECTFTSFFIDYLGHFISPRLLMLLQRTIYVTHNLKQPRNITEPRSSRGLGNTFQRFLPIFARVVVILHKSGGKIGRCIPKHSLNTSYSPRGLSRKA